jgi:hypothetical protein
MAGVSVRFKDGSCVGIFSNVGGDIARICKEALDADRPLDDGEYVIIGSGGEVVEEKPKEEVPIPDWERSSKGETRRILKPKKKGRR